MTFKLKLGKSVHPQTAAKELPATLSHYTDLRGMMGIIDNAEIWASNVSFLNDREELLYGLKSAVKVVGNIVSKSTFPYLPTGCAAWLSAVRRRWCPARC